MYLWWSLCTLYLHACQVSYRRRLGSLLLYLCYVFRALINSLVCWFHFQFVWSDSVKQAKEGSLYIHLRKRLYHTIIFLHIQFDNTIRLRAPLTYPSCSIAPFTSGESTVKYPSSYRTVPLGEGSLNIHYVWHIFLKKKSKAFCFQYLVFSLKKTTVF